MGGPISLQVCADQVIRRCIPEREIPDILSHCHDKATGGHFVATRTTNKVFQSGFYWPTIFKDGHRYVITCDECQLFGNISYKYELPLTNILVSEIFDV